MSAPESSATSERERMLAGELYDGFDPILVREREQARELLRRYNDTFGAGRELRHDLLRQLLGSAGEGVWIEPPFFCDYGRNIRLGRGVYLNFDCLILDCAPVDIGDGTLIGPGVHLYTAQHPLEPELRRQGRELAAPVRIGRNVWIGGRVVICPGVTIGDDSVIGAGSVVVKSIPAGVVAAGNPCRVIRALPA